MKKMKLYVLSVLAALLLFLVWGCAQNKSDEVPDYSEYPFTDIRWTRHAEHDVETIKFSSNGSFAYWCACGNPVNDSDLNDGYTYDDETKTITVRYFETTDETVSTIIIEECDDKSIKLNFNGEIREFFKDESN